MTTPSLQSVLWSLLFHRAHVIGRPCLGTRRSFVSGSSSAIHFAQYSSDGSTRRIRCASAPTKSRSGNFRNVSVVEVRQLGGDR